jgi:predicted RNase H-like HicB family nuclease
VEFQIVLERDPETGTWVAEAPGVNGAYTQGATKEEALANLREVFELLRETSGIPLQPAVEFAKLNVEA